MILKYVKLTLLRKRLLKFFKKASPFIEIDHMFWIVLVVVITYCQNNRIWVLQFIYLFSRLFVFSLPLFEFQLFVLFIHSFRVIYVLLLNLCCIFWPHGLWQSPVGLMLQSNFKNTLSETFQAYIFYYKEIKVNNTKGLTSKVT